MDTNLLKFLDEIIENKEMVTISMESSVFNYMINTRIYYYTSTGDDLEIYVENDECITLYDFDILSKDDEYILGNSVEKVVITADI